MDQETIDIAWKNLLVNGLHIFPGPNDIITGLFGKVIDAGFPIICAEAGLQCLEAVLQDIVSKDDLKTDVKF